MSPQWGGGPAEPRLESGDIHVWRVDLAAVDVRLAGLLSEEERERAGAMLREEDRRLWARSRGLLRALLGRYLRTDPQELTFTTGPHGKLQFADGDLPFNLSHSGGIALYAVSAAGQVGVDIEVERRIIDEVSIARRFLGGQATERLATLPPADRRREFLRAWVRHEAQLKCRGTGLGGVDGPTEVGGEHQGRLTDESERWIANLDVGPGAAAAVAAEGMPGELCCWTW